jgi:hypothetical protein
MFVQSNDLFFGPADTGASDPNPTVRTPSDGYVYPAVAAVVRVTVATE